MLTRALYVANTKPRFKGEAATGFFARAVLALDACSDERFATLAAKTRTEVNDAVKAANAGRSAPPKGDA